MTPDSQDNAPALRRAIGIAALRQIRRLVDEDIALEQWRVRWARRLGIAFAALGGLILLYLLTRTLS